MSLYGYSIKELENKLKKNDISVAELTEMSLDRVKEIDDEIKAFITVDEEGARKQAKELDEIDVADRQALFGIPQGMKDNVVTKGVRTTAASQILKNFNDPLYDATVVQKLKDAQSVMIGKVNLDEFAMGSTTESSSYQITRNPWNTDHVPGGSSGGSAAAVASGQVMFSIGSDTGGSIRQPAAFCGVVGMKPTYGLVSRFGLVGLASSLDHVGPITQTVEDNARVLEVIAGNDENDSTSANVQIPMYSEGLKGDIRGLKVAVPEEYLGDGISEEARESVLNALQMLELLGIEWEKISVPHSAYAAATYSILAAAEASTSLARFDGVRFGVRSENVETMEEMYKRTRSEGFGEEVKRRIMLGTFALSSGNVDRFYKKAQKVRTRIIEEFETIFNTYDLVIGPTTPTPAFKVGELVDSVTSYANDLLTIPSNLAGLPSISVPCGFTEEGLPLGMQIIGKHFDEQTVYKVAYAYEQATNHHKKRPVMGGK